MAKLTKRQISALNKIFVDKKAEKKKTALQKRLFRKSMMNKWTYDRFKRELAKESRKRKK